MSLILV